MSWVTLRFFADSLAGECQVSVFLPYGNMPSGKPLGTDGTNRETGYPHLYLLHGFQGDHESWLRNTAAERLAERYGVVIVMPAGGNSFYINHPARLFYMEDFLKKELPLFVERTLPVARKREARAVAGLSMGGYGALRLGLLYPEFYGAVASFSPPYVYPDPRIAPFFYGAFRETARAYFGAEEQWRDSDFDLYSLAQRWPELTAARACSAPFVYLACGEQDELLEGNRKMALELETLARRFPLSYLYSEGTGGHVWTYWERHLNRFLAEWTKRRPATLPDEPRL